MKKKTFYNELAYVFGMIFLALGTAFMEAADFGVSMVVAPSYIIHLKVSQYLPFFTFGMASYTFEALLLIVMVILLRKFRVSYLFSFVTAVLYGFVLDIDIWLLSFINHDSMVLRIIFYIVGLLLCSMGVSFYYHTYISPEVYELFVKEASNKYGIEIHKFKTGYDCISCLVAIILSFCFFGFLHFEGVKWGTVVCALVNGFTISRFTKLFERFFEFRDGLKLRKYFE